MKKPSDTQNQFIFAIYAEDKKGLIGQLLVFFNRRSYVIRSLNVSRTDISDLVLLTIEAEIPGPEVLTLKEKLKKIIEVHAVTVYPGSESLKKTGFYRLSPEGLNEPLWQLMQKYGATISFMEPGCLVIQKTGSDQDLAELYGLLEGPQLLGFCKSGLILEKSLVSYEQLEHDDAL